MHQQNIQDMYGALAADIFLPELGRMRMMTRLERDGKEDWEIVLPGNPFSFKAPAEWVSEQLGRSGKA